MYLVVQLCKNLATFAALNYLAKEDMEYEHTAEQDNATANAEADRKYARVVPINPAEIVDENGNAIDLTDTEALREWLLAKYKGRAVEVKDDGRTVRVTTKGIKAGVKRRGEAHRQLYADLVSLLENGVYSGYEPGDSRHPFVKQQNIYYASATVEGRIYGVRFKVDIHEGVSAGSYKDHKVAEIEIEKSPSLYDRLHKSGVAVQNENDFSIAVPKIKAAFTAKILQNFPNPTP